MKLQFWLLKKQQQQQKKKTTKNIYYKKKLLIKSRLSVYPQKQKLDKIQA